LDKGYDYPQIQQLAVELGYRPHIRSRGEEASHRQAGKRARRWVVERTHSWLNRFRGLLIRWAKKAKNYLAFLHLACGIITWRSIGLLG
jgi:transposase